MGKIMTTLAAIAMIMSSCKWDRNKQNEERYCNVVEEYEWYGHKVPPGYIDSCYKYKQVNNTK